MSLSDDAVRRFQSFLADAPAPEGFFALDQIEECRREQQRLRDAGEEVPLAELMHRRGYLSRFHWPKDAPAASSEAAAFSAAMLGKYILRREIARGGMGIVYEAMDPELKRRVAVKILKEGESGRAEVARLQREASIAAQLQHPNIVVIHEVGVDGDTHFIVMDYVEGRTFADVLRDPKADRNERLRILEEVARAVGFAHSKGVVHRDLKPANVLVETTGRVVLTDFGLARAESLGSGLTHSRAVMGTPQYMAPEQIDARHADIGPQTDVYALGVMLHEVLAGRPPFSASTPAELYWRVLNEEPPRPPGDRELVILSQKALEKDRSHRIADALVFAEDLARFRRGDPILTHPPSLLYQWSKRLARRKGIVVVAAAGVTVAVVLTAILVPRLSEARKRAIEQLRRRTENALSAALAHRRAGTLREMRRFAAETETACREVMEEMPDRPEPHYALGRMYRALMWDDAALVEQEAALARDPNYAPALYERVVLSVRRYRKRIRELVQEAWRIERGGDVPSRKSLGESDSEAKRQRSRLEADLESLRRRPEGLGPGEADCAAGLLAWIGGDPREARERLTSAIETSPTLEEAYEAMATLEMEHEDYDAAVRWWTRGVEADRGYLPHLEERGEAQHVWGCASPDEAATHFARAVEDFSKSIARDDTRDRPYQGRGAVRTSLAQFDAAIRDLDEALKRSPRSYEARLGRGFALWKWGTREQELDRNPADVYARAMEDFSKAIELNPDRDSGWLLRGLTRLNAGDDPAAILDFDAALSRNSGRDRTWMGRATAHWNLAVRAKDENRDPVPEYRLAIEDYGEALKRNDRRAQTWIERATCRVELGLRQNSYGESFRLAVQEFQEALKRTREPYSVWKTLAETWNTWAWLRQQDSEDPKAQYEEAIRASEEALKGGRDVAEIRLARGKGRLALAGWRRGHGDDPSDLYRAAIEELSKARESDARNAAILWYLGEAYRSWASYRASGREDARSEYRDALRFYEEAGRMDEKVASRVRDAIEECRKYLSENPQ